MLYIDIKMDKYMKIRQILIEIEETEAYVHVAQYQIAIDALPYYQ
jgi:hypothetical protein